jgi:hypothetical protein
MKIEFTKKQLIIVISAISVIVLSFIVGYFAGLNSERNPKGDGKHFYVEETPPITKEQDSATILVYHSTIDCPNIIFGVKMDRYGYSFKRDASEIYPYSFCPKCMDTELIDSCEKRIISAFRAK